MKKNSDILNVIVFGIFFLTFMLPRYIVLAESCGCATNECCSKWGYCGTGDDYCGDGCRSGPCNPAPAAPTTNDVSVADIVTDDFFNGIIGQAGSNCPGKNFYSRSAFLDALGGYPNFGRVGTVDDSKREIAAFFAHVTHETGRFCYIEENDKSDNHCDPAVAEYPCKSNQGYYGRGPIQLTGNYNYGLAGDSLRLDLLSHPEIVANDPVVSFRTAFWYWMQNVHSKITSGEGFGSTIRAINGVECDGRNTAAVQARVQYYKQYCDQFQVAPGDKLEC